MNRTRPKKHELRKLKPRKVPPIDSCLACKHEFVEREGRYKTADGSVCPSCYENNKHLTTEKRPTR